MNRKINLDDLHHVEASSIIPLARNTGEIVQAIFKVRNPGYVPAEVSRRAAMDPFIFTGEFKYGDLHILESDPKVESVSINRKLKSAK